MIEKLVSESERVSAKLPFRLLIIAITGTETAVILMITVVC